MNFQGTIRDGRIKLNPTYSKVLAKYITKLEGKKIDLSLKKIRSKRSNAQNSYYWKIVVTIVHAGLIDLGHELSIEDASTF